MNVCVTEIQRTSMWEPNVALMFLKRSPNGQFPSVPQCPLSSKRYTKGPLEGPTRTHGVALTCGAHTLSV